MYSSLFGAPLYREGMVHARSELASNESLLLLPPFELKPLCSLGLTRAAGCRSAPAVYHCRDLEAVTTSLSHAHAAPLRSLPTLDTRLVLLERGTASWPDRRSVEQTSESGAGIEEGKGGRTTAARPVGLPTPGFASVEIPNPTGLAVAIRPLAPPRCLLQVRWFVPPERRSGQAVPRFESTKHLPQAEGTQRGRADEKIGQYRNCLEIHAAVVQPVQIGSQPLGSSQANTAVFNQRNTSYGDRDFSYWSTSVVLNFDGPNIPRQRGLSARSEIVPAPLLVHHTPPAECLKYMSRFDDEHSAHRPPELPSGLSPQDIHRTEMYVWRYLCHIIP